MKFTCPLPVKIGWHGIWGKRALEEVTECGHIKENKDSHLGGRGQWAMKRNVAGEWKKWWEPWNYIFKQVWFNWFCLYFWYL